ncbi:MAG: hypothetical protein ACRDJE_04695 [Dehalococcoidia bacterium]
MTTGHERFVLHPSVGAHWWLSSALHERAELLRTRMYDGLASAVVLEGFDVRVTQLILAGLQQGLRLTEEARRLIEIDAQEEVEDLIGRRALLVMPARELQGPASTVVEAAGITTDDATYAVLAEALQRSLDVPLLVADRILEDRLRSRARLRVVWLGDYG